MRRNGKAMANENRHPYVIEVAVAGDALDVELGRQIMQFHKSRHIQPRHGRRIKTGEGYFYRWCFSDLSTARSFVEGFDGEFCKPSNSAKLPGNDDPS
jgi:hypothetical protein